MAIISDTLYQHNINLVTLSPSINVKLFINVIEILIFNPSNGKVN